MQLVLDIGKLQLSINKLVQHHDSFTLRYKKDKGASNVYTQYYDTSTEVEEVKKLDIRTLEEKEDSKEFTIRLQEILTSWQSEFNLEQGPIYSIGYIYGYGDRSSRIHFALHHLIVDAVSWRILTEDLMDIYNQEDVHLTPNMSKGSSYRQWVDALKQYGNNNESEKEYWNNVLSDYDNNNLLALVPHENTNHNSGFSLSSKQTKQLLQQSNRAYNTQVNDILLTSLGYALSEALNSKVNHIVLEGHGREEIDNSIDVTRALLCARYFSPPLRQMRSPLHTNFFAAFCHPPC